MDLSQTFDRVWTTRLLCKLSDYLRNQIILLLASYLSDRLLQIHLRDSVSPTHYIHVGFPQGSVLPLLFLLYTTDLPVVDSVATATFADDTAVLASSENYNDAVKCLQHSIDRISKWAKH